MKWKWWNKIERLKGKEDVLKKFDTLTLNYLLIRYSIPPTPEYMLEFWIRRGFGLE